MKKPVHRTTNNEECAIEFQGLARKIAEKKLTITLKYWYNIKMTRQNVEKKWKRSDWGQAWVPAWMENYWAWVWVNQKMDAMFEARICSSRTERGRESTYTRIYIWRCGTGWSWVRWTLTRWNLLMLVLDHSIYSIGAAEYFDSNRPGELAWGIFSDRPPRSETRKTSRGLEILLSGSL